MPLVGIEGWKEQLFTDGHRGVFISPARWKILGVDGSNMSLALMVSQYLSLT